MDILAPFLRFYMYLYTYRCTHFMDILYPYSLV